MHEHSVTQDELMEINCCATGLGAIGHMLHICFQKSAASDAKSPLENFTVSHVCVSSIIRESRGEYLAIAVGGLQLSSLQMSSSNRGGAFLLP